MLLGVLILGWAGIATAATWTSSTNQVPGATEGDHDMPYELGTKFKTTVKVPVLKARIYVAATETGALPCVFGA